MTSKPLFYKFVVSQISKSNVVDDVVASNSILYKEGEKPDHCVVIKYVPYVGKCFVSYNSTSRFIQVHHNI